MKKISVIVLALCFSVTSFAMTKLPADVTDDLLKTVAVELLINNVSDNYKVTKLTAGRIDDNGYELAAGFVTLTKTNGICMKVAASVRADTCTNLETNCKLDAYALDCQKNSETLSADLFKGAKELPPL